MTGFYVRAMRGGCPMSLDIAELTDDELADLVARGKLDGKWAASLAAWIRDNVKASPADQADALEGPDNGPLTTDH